MTSLEELRGAIEAVDPNNLLSGLSYGITYNQSLGFGQNPSTFHVFIPYETWAQFGATELRSILEASFIDTLVNAGNAPATSGYFFIDIAQLNGGLGDFFVQNVGSSPSVVQTIANVVNGLATTNPDLTPVVRFLVGRDPGNNDSWSSITSLYSSMFWPNGTPLVTNQKAVMYVGYYGPNFQLSGGDDGAKATEIAPMVGAVGNWLKLIWDKFGDLLKLAAPDEAAKVDKAFANLDPHAIAEYLLLHSLPTISWNHAKIVAVNGTTVMTGGGNYWAEYQNNANEIVDQQAKVKGDAAISAHIYCDYFWDYLNKLPSFKTDTRSMMGMTNMASSSAQWETSTPPSPLFNQKPTATQGIPVLTVGRLGDWFGPMKDLQYPVQLIDALRDLALNVAWQIVSAKFPSLMFVFNMLVDGLADSNPDVQASLKTLGITPAAWASRIARITAIKNAKTSIHISTEMFVDFLMDGNSDWQALVADINKDAGVSWDGHMWAYDLLQAFGTFLHTLSSSPDDEQGGVWIVLTTNQAGKHDGWQDVTKISDFKGRLKAVMGAMFTDQSADDISKLVDAKFHVRRILDNSHWFNHCKVVCVDRKILYIGSDNTYPSYNEEHGIWVDDATAIGNWYSGFYDTLWAKSSDPAPDD